MRKPAAKSFAGWRSTTACTNTSPSDAEVRGRFTSRKPFSAEVFRRQIGELYGDRMLFLQIVSTDLYMLYVEGNVYLHGAWYRIFL